MKKILCDLIHFLFTFCVSRQDEFSTVDTNEGSIHGRYFESHHRQFISCISRHRICRRTSRGIRIPGKFTKHNWNLNFKAEVLLFRTQSVDRSIGISPTLSFIFRFLLLEINIADENTFVSIWFDTINVCIVVFTYISESYEKESALVDLNSYSQITLFTIQLGISQFFFAHG